MSSAQKRRRGSKDSLERRGSSDLLERTSASPDPPALSKHREHRGSNRYSSKRRGDDQAAIRSRKSPAIAVFLALCTAVGVLGGLFWFFSEPAELDLPLAASGPANSSVYARGLVTARGSYQSVLSEHARYWNNVSHRHFQSSVLAYVTPWNGKGYDMAKLFRAKFTHVSPVWYQLRRDQETLSLHGKHDVDQQWIKDVRQEGSPLIVPRVVLEGWPLDILIKRGEREKAIHLIVNEIIEMEFDGIVLEAWTLWRSHQILEDPRLRKKALEFVKLLGLKFQSMKISHQFSSGPPQLIFVIPPPGKPSDPSSFSSSDVSYLRDVVHGFSLMTYDYSSPQYPGPNAPLPWVQQCLHLLFPSGFKDNREKMLMGINFYGNDYIISQGGGPIVGGQYISILAQYRPQITWDEASKEHFFEYVKDKSMQTRNRVYYPSLKSLAARLREAKSWGVGVSIWEIGQGLDYFFDLL